MIELESNDEIFGIEGCLSIGHLMFMIDSIVQLSESRNRQMKILSQEIINIVNTKTMDLLKTTK